MDLREKVAMLARGCEACTVSCPTHKECMDKADAILSLVAEAHEAALWEALEKYGQHMGDCNADLSDDDDIYQCTCGLDAALAKEADK